jgi:hypothetical protein
VRALTLYPRAWHDLAHCRPRTAGCPAGEDARLDAAAASFRTPADARAHVAVGDALDQGGISLDDFPKSLRNYVFMWSGMPFGEPEAACIQARAGRTPR